jgi:putative membrane protein
MSIEGILEVDGLRDFLYSRMRGARGETPSEPTAGTAPADEALGLLREIRDELAALRETGGTPASGAGEIT